jgi:hypothetical protein
MNFTFLTIKKDKNVTKSQGKKATISKLCYFGSNFTLSHVFDNKKQNYAV